MNSRIRNTQAQCSFTPSKAHLRSCNIFFHVGGGGGASSDGSVSEGEAEADEVPASRSGQEKASQVLH